MNEQQPYEKRLAEKFQQLPLPDVEPNWQQMKSLLDKQMPRGGGYWRWVTAIVILLMMLGGTWYITSHNELVGTKNIAVNKRTGSTKQDTASGISSLNSGKKDAGSQKQIEMPPSSANAAGQTADQQLLDSKNTATNEENLHNKLSIGTDLASGKSNQQTNKIVADKNSTYGPGKEEGSIADKKPKYEVQKNETLSNKKITSEKISGKKTGQTSNQVQGYQNYLAAETPAKNSPVHYKAQNSTADFNVAQLFGDSVKQHDYSGIFPESKLNDKQQSAKTKSAKSRDKYMGENKNLAIGFSLPLGFPLGDQKPGAYNINAKPNIVSDFIPVPHLQYHINNKVYLQTELQLMNPQYIQPVLLYQRKTEFPTTGTVQYNSVYARKLYYFNLPVGIHYSPFQHFYLGTGLQFSSLVSGVALSEETSSVMGGRPDLISQRYTKFKNDSISNRIDNSEFRLMLDANYYWKQFTVGLRYNQALSNYVSLRLNNASPFFEDKNKSLQFYLRYNLWEDHKKKKK